MGNLTYSSIRSDHPRVYINSDQLAALPAKAASWSVTYTAMRDWAIAVLPSSIVPYRTYDVYGNVARQTLTVAMVACTEMQLGNQSVALGLLGKLADIGTIIYNPTSTNPDINYAIRYPIRGPSYPSNPSLESLDRLQSGRQLCGAQAIIWDTIFRWSSLSSRFTASFFKAIGEDAVRRTGDLTFAAPTWNGSGTRVGASNILTGHGAENSHMCLVVALALSGEKSGTTYDFTAGTYRVDTLLSNLLDYWYGGNDTITPDGDPRFHSFRYFGQNGGGTRGGWYWCFGFDYAGSILHHMNNAFVGMELTGNPYSPFVFESWLTKSWRWLIETAVRSDKEHAYWHDTYKTTNPRVPVNFWDTIALNMAHAETSDARNMARFVWNRKIELAGDSGQSPTSYFGGAYSFMNLGDTTEPNMDSVAPKSQFLDPPGTLFCRNKWDLKTATTVRIDTPQYHYESHNDMKRGAISIDHYMDNVIGDSGQYDTFGGIQHRGWRTQTIAASGVVLVDDRAVNPHRTTCAGISTANKTTLGMSLTEGHPVITGALGSQYWKRDPDYAGAAYANYYEYDCQTVNLMTGRQNATYGHFWKCCESRTDTTVAGKVIVDDSNVLIYSTNLRRAYRRNAGSGGAGGANDGEGGSTERVRRYDARWMIIKNFGGITGRMAVLMIHRVESRLSTMVKRMMWHFWFIESITQDQAKNRLRIVGRAYDSTNKPAGVPGVRARVAVDMYDYDYWTWPVPQVGDQNVADAVYSNRAHYHESAGGSHNWGLQGKLDDPNGSDATDFLYRDLKKTRAEIRPANARAEDYFVCLIQPYTLNNDNVSDLLDYSWTNTDPDYYGVSCNGQVYEMHKDDENLYKTNADPPDTQPPAVPTGLVLTTPTSQTIQAVWTPNTTDPDFNRFRVWYRPK